LDESLLVFPEGDGLLANRPEAGSVSVSVIEGDLEGMQTADRGASFVVGVSEAVELGVEKGLAGRRDHRECCRAARM
jgi:hypothetical protein